MEVEYIKVEHLYLNKIIIYMEILIVIIVYIEIDQNLEHNINMIQVIYLLCLLYKVHKDKNKNKEIIHLFLHKILYIKIKI